VKNHRSYPEIIDERNFSFFDIGFYNVGNGSYASTQAQG
jgi:hypothetical protein